MSTAVSANRPSCGPPCARRATPRTLSAAAHCSLALLIAAACFSFKPSTRLLKRRSTSCTWSASVSHCLLSSSLSDSSWSMKPRWRSMSASNRAFCSSSARWRSRAASCASFRRASRWRSTWSRSSVMVRALSLTSTRSSIILARTSSYTAEASAGASGSEPRAEPKCTGLSGSLTALLPRLRRSCRALRRGPASLSAAPVSSPTSSPRASGQACCSASSRYEWISACRRRRALLGDAEPCCDGLDASRRLRADVRGLPPSPDSEPMKPLICVPRSRKTVGGSTRAVRERKRERQSACSSPSSRREAHTGLFGCEDEGSAPFSSDMGGGTCRYPRGYK